MARTKYLSDDVIKPNHWYVDKKGERFLYLGIGEMHYGVDPNSGDGKGYFYLKESALKKHFSGNLNSIPVYVMFQYIVQQKTKQYCYSSTPKKFCYEDGLHPNLPLKGWIGVFEFL